MRFFRLFTAIILILQLMLPCMNQSVFAESIPQINSGGSYNPTGGPAYPLDEDSYFTDDSGNILMYINILGEVSKGGPLIVKEKVNFAKILSLVGVTPNADLETTEEAD